jgi:hypothetical protein
MMNVEEMRETMPVNLGARAIALSLVIWHLGSDNDTGMMSIIGIGCYDLLLEEVSQRIKETPPDLIFLVADVVAAVGSITIKTQHDMKYRIDYNSHQQRVCSLDLFLLFWAGRGLFFRGESYNIKYARLGCVGR